VRPGSTVLRDSLGCRLKRNTEPKRRGGLSSSNSGHRRVSRAPSHGHSGPSCIGCLALDATVGIRPCRSSERLCTSVGKQGFRADCRHGRCLRPADGGGRSRGLSNPVWPAACTTANGCFRKVNQNGGTDSYPAANASWAGEIALDIDMVSAICPNCNILLVEANRRDLRQPGAGGRHRCIAWARSPCRTAMAVPSGAGRDDLLDRSITTTRASRSPPPPVTVATTARPVTHHRQQRRVPGRFAICGRGRRHEPDAKRQRPRLDRVGLGQRQRIGAGSGCSVYEPSHPGSRTPGARSEPSPMSRPLPILPTATPPAATPAPCTSAPQTAPPACRPTTPSWPATTACTASPAASP
jgi:hypothetical protein